MGAVWIGCGLSFVLLLRGLPLHGRLAATTVLLAIWAGDTLAYAGGRLLGSHAMAPSTSPGKTWEGFVFGSAATVFVCFVALYKAHFLTVTDSLLLGAAIAVAAPLGDLFESMLKRDAGVKDAGSLLAGHGGLLDRIDAILFAAPAAYFCILALRLPLSGRRRARRPLPWTPMKRIALLGASGSIGRQALEVIAANPDLELVAATSGSRPIVGLAPLTQTGGDPVGLLERAAPDVVLNAVVGFAGLAPTMWALENGVTLALANKESLVAAGELALEARSRGGGALIPVDSEHSALFQCALLGEPESVVLTASGGPFRGKRREELDRGHAGAGARAPHLVDGPEDHDRLGHARQQGARGHRGSLPLRSRLRPHRGRDPPALARARPRSLP